MVGDGRQSVNDKKPQRYAKTTEDNSIPRSGKSEAEVTNNRRVRSKYCSIEARPEASCGLGDSRATCYRSHTPRVAVSNMRCSGPVKTSVHSRIIIALTGIFYYYYMLLLL